MSNQGMFDQDSLDISCPECGASIAVKVGEARKSPTVTCPNGHSVKLDASQFDRGLRDVQRGIDDLFK